MSNSLPSRVSLETLVREVTTSPRCGRGEVSIWGGCCPMEQLADFLGGWALSAMPYRIWEYVSGITFGRDTLPENGAFLERGRLFGEGGDLEIRREVGLFRWRFVGPAGISAPEGAYGARDYWAHHPEAWFYRYEETALLWGWGRDRYGRDPRVGAVHLDYPGEGERFRLRYWVFSRHGRAAFVWYRELTPGEENRDV